MTTYKPVGVDGSSHFPPRVEAHIQALIDASVAALVAGAPGALDTLNEIAAQLSTDESATAALVASLAAHTSNTSNPHSVTKTQVGLGSADNTADTAKPVSTAQATAIALKADTTALTTETTRATAAEVALQNLTNSTFVAGLNNAYARLVEAVNTVATSGAAQTIPDPSVQSVTDVTLTAATVALTFPTLAAGKAFTVVVRQDGTGSRLVTWPGTVKWPGGAAPTLSTAASAIDVFTFLTPAGTSWYGFPAGFSFA